MEDDCISYRPHPFSLAQYPTDAITLLGGCFRGFGKWGLCETSYINAGKFLDTTVHLPRGVHEIPVQTMRQGTTSQMRWAMCVAYYMPPGMAAQLIDVVDSANKKTCSRRLTSSWHHSPSTSCGHQHSVTKGSRACVSHTRRI